MYLIGLLVLYFVIVTSGLLRLGETFCRAEQSYIFIVFLSYV